MKHQTVLTFTLLAVLIQTFGFDFVKSENILFLTPICSKSHKNVFDPIIDALAYRNHTVNVISPFKSSKPPKNVREIQPMTYEEIFGGLPDPLKIRKNGKLASLTSWNMTFVYDACDKIWTKPEFRAIFENGAKYDLIFINGFMNDCFKGILHKLGSPFIIFTTIAAPNFIAELAGNHLPPSFVPVPFGDMSHKMSFGQRIKNILMTYMPNVVLGWTYYPVMEEIYRRHMNDANLPGVSEIDKKVSLIMQNANFVLNYPRPLLPDVIDVGGMHCRPANPLPKDLESWIGGAKNGLIFFSLGSIFKPSNMPLEVKMAFIKAFSKLPQRVLWKWDEDQIDGLSENVKLIKWAPQQDILGHKNIRLFITHGGLLSTQEASYHGVPLLGIPLFGDQDLNMQQAEAAGYAITQEILDLTEKQLSEKINALLNDRKYSKKATELSRVLRDYIESPVEKAVFWSEFIMRHKGAPFLRSAARDLNFLQYHSIDVLAFLSTVIFLTLYTIKNILSFICSLFFGKKNIKIKRN